MNSKFLRGVSIAALSVALMAGVQAHAQTAALEASVASDLDSVGIMAESIGPITTEQLLEIKNILGSNDSESEQKMKIEAILGMTAGKDAEHLLGKAQLEDSTAAEMARLGIDASRVEMLTVEQLARIENVISSNEQDDEKTKQIEVILDFPNAAEVKSPLGVDQLRDSVRASISKLGADTSKVDMLSMSKLSELELVVGSSDDDQQKRARIDIILSQ